jgi:hypothetical protein
LVVFFLLLPLWFLLTPFYNRLLAAGVNMVLPFIEDPHVRTLVGWKYNIMIVRSDIPVTAGMKIQGFTGYLTHFNLILMSALVLASGHVVWRRRCAILASALGMLFMTHMLYLLVGVKFFEQPELEAFQSAAGRFYIWGTNFYLSIAGQLLPVVLWIGLLWVFGEIPEGARAAYERGAPEPKEKKRGGGRRGDRVP